MKNILILIILAGFTLLAGCKNQQSATTSQREPQRIREVSQIEQLESTARLIEATKQRILGNHANAVVLYAEAARIDPRNSAALYELAKLHIQQGYSNEAEKFAIQAVLLEPDNKYYNLLLADILFLQNKNDQGLRVHDHLARIYPHDLDIQITKLSSLIYMNRFNEAIKLFDHLESVGGFNPEMSVQKQRVLMEMERPDLALKEAKRLVEIFPQEIAFLEMLAELYNENDQREEAYKVYQQMLEIQPDSPLANLLLADYYRSIGDEERSFDQLKNAFSTPLLELDGKARIMASYYYMGQEDTLYSRQAMELCKLLIETHPEEAQAHAIYGDFLYREGELIEARNYYYTAASLDPSELNYWQQILSIDASMENFSSMAETSSKALDYFFEQPVLYFFNGIAHLQLKNYHEAIEALKSGRDLSESQPELLNQFLVLLGDTYFKLKDNVNSFQHYEEALAVNPDNAYALNNYSYYLSQINQNLEKASRMSARSLELEPGNASFQDTYGWIQYKKGDYQQAKIWIGKAIENSEDPSAVVFEHYGDVLYKLGNKEDAVHYWKKALEYQNDDEDDVSEFLEKKILEGKLYE
jgi:tetratricopeptide (TPR) repeat protein